MLYNDNRGGFAFDNFQEKTLGANHPDLADTLIALGRAEQHLHRMDRARRHLDRALALPVTDPRVREEARKLLGGGEAGR